MSDLLSTSLTAAYDATYFARNRRQQYLLGFLIFFFVTVGGYLVFDRKSGSTFFDSKGILTGSGTSVLLLAAVLAALIVYLIVRMRVERGNRAEMHALHKKAAGVVEWLSKDVLGNGLFKGKHAAIEVSGSAEFPSIKYSVTAASPLTLRVWCMESQRTPLNSEFKTSDPDFERECSWQSPVPQEALNFLDKKHVTSVFKRLCWAAKTEVGVRIEQGTISFEPTRLQVNEAVALVFLFDLAFLADTLERKPGHALLEENVEKVKIGKSGKWSCLTTLLFVVIPGVLIWIAGSYWVSNALGIGAGMICFFLPVMLLAIFVFTLPVVGRPTFEIEGEEYCEKCVRTDHECVILLEKYAQRLNRT